MAVFTVPSNMCGQMVHWDATLQGVGTKSAVLTTKYREEGGLLLPKDNKHLAQNGATLTENDYIVGDYLAPMTDIVVSANSADADLAISAGFDIILKELTIPTSEPVKGF